MSFSTSTNSSSDSGLLSPPASFRSNSDDSNKDSRSDYNMTLQSYSASLCGYHLAAARKAANLGVHSPSKSTTPLSNMNQSRIPKTRKKEKSPSIVPSLVMHSAQQDLYNEKF